MKHVRRTAAAFIVIAGLVTSTQAVACGWTWDGAAWADYRPWLSPINAATQARLRAIAANGAALGRVLGRLGQFGDSITLPAVFVNNALLYGETSNETGHDYAAIRSWLAYSGTQPADAFSFYRTHGKGAAYGNASGWSVAIALAAGQPQAAIESGDGNVPGEFSWALVMFGANDINSLRWDAVAYKDAMRVLLQQFIDLGVIPVVSTLPPQQPHIADGHVEELNAALSSLAWELQIPVVDFHSLVLHFQPEAWQVTLMGADGTHPTGGTNGRGFSELAQSTTDGYALRTKLTFDMAEKLRAIVFEAGTPDRGDSIPPTVSILSPAGGESYPANIPQLFTWSASDNVNVSSVDLDLSLDGGGTYPISIAQNIPNTGSCVATMPGVGSTTARVRVTVRDTCYNTATSASASDFNIEQLLPVSSRAPGRFGLAAFPNPAAGAMRIEMSIPRTMAVRLSLVDAGGREVRRFATGEWSAGVHGFDWDVRAGGLPAPPGVYFVRLESPERTELRRAVVVLR